MITYEDVKHLRPGDQVKLKVIREDLPFRKFSEFLHGAEVVLTFSLLGLEYDEKDPNGHIFNWILWGDGDAGQAMPQHAGKNARLGFHLWMLDEVERYDV